MPRRGVTLFMAVLACFGLVLGRWSGQREVVVGTPIANRTRGELEGLIGFFVNTLALRVDLGGLPSGVGLLGRAREVALAGYDHQAVPFEQVVEALHPDRSLDHAPVFQAMLVLQNAPGEGLALEGLAVESLALAPLGSKFDVGLSVAEVAGRLDGVLEYDGRLFDAATMARFAADLGARPRGAGAGAGAAAVAPRVCWRLRSARACSGLERGFGGRGGARGRRFGSVVALIAARAARSPAAAAVEGDGTVLSYGALWSRSGALARRLRDLGVGPESVVGLGLERGLDLVVGCWRSGGPAAPICRSIPTIRRAGSAISWPIAGSASPSAATACAARLAPALAPRHAVGRDRSTRPLPAADDDDALPGPAHPLQTRLCHLYLRFNRTTQTRPNQPWQPAEPHAVAEPALWSR